MKLGAEPKKVAILAVLLVIAAVSFWMNVFSDDTPAANPAQRPASPPPAASSAPAAISRPANATTTAGEQPAQSVTPRGSVVRAQRAGSGDQRLAEFRPVFKSTRRGEALDPTKVDPTLQTELLAKLREVRMQGSGRNLFQFGQAPPPPKPPEPKIIPKPVEVAGPVGADGQPLPTQPVKPPPPPIPLRYYGFVEPRVPGEKRAFFMEGEEIRIAGEGELIKQRFRVVQISSKSAVVEDTQFDNRQTLAIQPESGT
jgi:hypothetical protein